MSNTGSQNIDFVRPIDSLRLKCIWRQSTLNGLPAAPNPSPVTRRLLYGIQNKHSIAQLRILTGWKYHPSRTDLKLLLHSFGRLTCCEISMDFQILNHRSPLPTMPRSRMSGYRWNRLPHCGASHINEAQHVSCGIFFASVSRF
jgi:hypothetical protein